MKNKIKAFIRDQDGLTIVEYAVAGGLISAVVAGTFMALGVTVNGVIVTLNAAIGG
jgi:pilus assembly protein Flp/PilA